MKHIKTTSFAAAAALLLTGTSGFAALTFSPGYSGSSYYTHSNSDSLYSYDWGSDGKLYYATGTSSYTFGGFYSYDGVNQSTIAGANGNYSGASVVAIGSSIYYNDSTNTAFNIYRYNVNTGSTVSLNTPNYALGTDGTNLLTTGSANWTITDIQYHANGDLGPAVNLGGVAGSSGPLAFDSQGNLFYAPGYGDLSIYRWSASEVAAAISSGGVNALAADGHLWLDYSTSFGTASGATSLLLDSNGDLFVTLTSFSDPSALVKFDADGSGAYSTLLTSNERLGELRKHDGNYYVSDANQIFQVVPEPSSLLLSIVACGVGVMVRRRD